MKERGMRRIKRWGSRLLREESGQSIAEYVLILFIVVILAMKVKGLLKTNLEGLVNKTGQRMNEFGNDEIGRAHV